MGELDLIKVCGAYNPGAEGYRNAFLTVLYTWVPLALAGLAIGWTDKVHPTMRGAGPLSVLARLAITILVAAIAIPLLVAAMYVDYVSGGEMRTLDILAALTITLAITAPIATLGGAGIIAWHRVLVALASREGEHRMLV